MGGRARATNLSKVLTLKEGVAFFLEKKKGFLKLSGGSWGKQEREKKKRLVF